jgi:hypothetical protein
MNGEGFCEIAVRRRGGSLPFQSGGLPGIIIGDSFTPTEGINQINDKGQLRQA